MDDNKKEKKKEEWMIIIFADSPVLTAASFNDALLSSGFETVEYIGAFGTDDNWLDGWTNFDPNNTDY